MNLIPLYEEAIQFNNYNGTVLAAGKVEVWYLGRTRKADIYADVAGETPLPNPLDLNDLGMQEVYVNPAFNYTLVVYDPYGSELFSVDKYLQGAGAHTTSNVVVQPSESIAVSAWTVGEVQIYQPYLTGQLGKVYEGIEPIVVNNQLDKISAQHVPLGVQDPLYFVQDDEEGCIIGLSGGAVPEGTMNESAFGYQDGQITGYNGSAFSAGNTYEEGSYIDIDGNTINVTGLQPAGDYQSAGDYVSASELENLQPKGDYYSASNPSGFITGVDLTEYAKTEDLTAYQEKGDYYSASNPSGFINSDAISSMATTGFVADVSGDITALIPTDLFTKESADTLYQPIGNYQTAGNYVSSTELTAYATTSLVSSVSSTITGMITTGDFELVAGTNIELVDDAVNHTTTINMTADIPSTAGLATTAQLAEVSGDITAQIPTDLFTKASADTLYYPLNSNPNGYLTAETDWSDTITAASANAYNEATAAIPTGLATEDWVTAQGYLTAHQDLSDYQTTAGMTAYQPAGDYLTTADSAEFYTTANESGFITGVDLTPYQLTADMTAYQPAGDYLTTGDSANFYTTANESGFITGIPDTYLQNTDLTITDNKVTEISGIPLAAGGEVPEGVLVESGLEFNAVNEISGYSGSAIAQYGAEKQWLTHDDTIVHISNSAQYAFGVNLSGISADLAKMMGVDETVLWSGANKISACDLSETPSNFNRLKVTLSDQNGKGTDVILEPTSATAWPANIPALGPNGAGISLFWLILNNLTFTVEKAKVMSTEFTGNNANWSYSTDIALKNAIKKVVGIGRKN